MGHQGGNAIETELKYLGADAEALRAGLRGAGARLGAERRLETNLVFDDDAGSLRATDRLLRLRDGRELTVKLPVKSDRYKSRREITVPVEGGPVEDLLEALGYRVAARYEKYREGWDLDGMWITIDEMPFLGTVVEIEGDGGKIDETARRVGLDGLETSTMNYLALFAEHAAKRGISADEMTFDAERRIS